MSRVYLAALDERSQPPIRTTPSISASVIEKLERALGCNIDVRQIKNLRIIK